MAISLFAGGHGGDFRGKVVDLLFDSFTDHQSAESNHLGVVLVQQADVEEILRSCSDSSQVVREIEIDLEDTSGSQAPIFIASSGCSTDCCQLQRTVRADFRAASYFGQISRYDPDQVANMLSQTL
jgi:hypothetical protein